MPPIILLPVTLIKMEKVELKGFRNNYFSEIKEQARADAQAERERQVEAAKAEIEQEANRTRKELAGRVSDLAIAGAEKILVKEIDRAAHNELLDKLAAEI